MILYKKEPFPLQMRNVMLLDDTASGGVVYVGKNTYDQALLLFGRMDGDPKRVLSLLTTTKTEAYRATPGLKNIVEDMMNTMPKPLNMIAPFLIYCVQNQGIDWSEVDRVFAYGILHQYSQLVDLNGVTLIPAEVRNNITVPTALLKSYEESWNDICQSLKDLVTLSPATAVKEQINTPVVTATPTQPAPATKTNADTASQPASVSPALAAAPAQNTGVPKEETMEEKIARISAENRARTEAARKAAEEAKKKQAAISGGAPTVSPQAQKKTEEAAAASDVLAEFDI